MSGAVRVLPSPETEAEFVAQLTRMHVALGMDPVDARVQADIVWTRHQRFTAGWLDVDMNGTAPDRHTARRATGT